MKLLKKKIFFLVISILLGIANSAQAGTLWLRSGIYDFKDDASKKFYKFGWSGRISYDFFDYSGISIGITTGVSYSSVPYNNDDHEMAIIPILLSWKYTVFIDNTRFRPFFGSGIGLYEKIDSNETSTLGNRHSGTYGYHFLSGLAFKLNDKIITSFEMNYNTIITKLDEDFNSSGFDILFGLGYTF